jgi:hypothetical protein
MLDTAWTSADSIEFLTDSARGKQRGFGIYFQGRWAQANWPNEWAERYSDFVMRLTNTTAQIASISLRQKARPGAIT